VSVSGTIASLSPIKEERALEEDTSEKRRTKSKKDSSRAPDGDSEKKKDGKVRSEKQTAVKKDDRDDDQVGEQKDVPLPEIPLQIRQMLTEVSETKQENSMQYLSCLDFLLPFCAQYHWWDGMKSWIDMSVIAAIIIS
jgi:hypothetical protein